MAGFLALSLLFLLLFSLNFYFGFWEWLRPRDDAPLPVDVEYVRVENYFGISFRAKMKQWLQTARPVSHSAPGLVGAPVRAVLEKPGGERILLVTGGRFGGRDERDEMVYSEGGLYLSDRSVFRREIYCLGNLTTGGQVQLQAVAADGEIVLGVANDVARWVDARKKILISRNTVVHSRVSSGESIELEPEVSAQSLYAPLVFTSGYRPAPGSGLNGERDEGLCFAGRRSPVRIRPGSSLNFFVFSTRFSFLSLQKTET